MAKEYAEWFYNSKQWRKLRQAYLSAHPLCERCLAKGETVPAKIAHHRIYLTPKNINNPDISLSWDNLEALCQTCHTQEHLGESITIDYAFGTDGQIVPIEKFDG
jgi:5-methylcytosine-specific restriction protein A